MARASPAPVYVTWGFRPGLGIVGGKTVSGFTQGEAAARIARRILDTGDTEGIPLIRKAPNVNVFDYQALEDADIDVEELPPESIVHNRPFSVYETYRGQIWAIAGFIGLLLAVLILLAFNVRRRKRSEAEVRQLNIDLEDEERLSRLAESTSIDLAPLDKVFVDGDDVTSGIRDTDVERGVSLVAKVAGVREALVEQQQALAQGGKIVMAGRDIGTTVLPRSELKVYLCASFEERARRRYLEVVGRGEAADYQAVLTDLKRRDEIDSERAVSPLQPAQDARLVDTDGLNVEQVLLEILGMMGEG